MRTALTLLALVAFNGCATNFEPKPLPADHPASAQALEAPRSGIKRLVATDQLTARTKAQLTREEVPNPDFQNSGTSPDTGKMPGMDMSESAATGSPKTGTMPGMDAAQMKNMEFAPTSSPATKEKAVEIEMKKTSDEMKKTSDELKAKSDEPQRAESVGGKSQESSPTPIIYTCLMHPEVQLAAPGKCPKCGRTLVKKEPSAP